MSIFVDTAGILAVLDADDHFHVAADVSWQEILSSRVDLFTTTMSSLNLCPCSTSAGTGSGEGAAGRHCSRDRSGMGDGSYPSSRCGDTAFSVGEDN